MQVSKREERHGKQTGPIKLKFIEPMYARFVNGAAQRKPAPQVGQYTTSTGGRMAAKMVTEAFGVYWDEGK
jgi:hypothetical protein